MALLEVENLRTEFRTKDGTVTAVDGVSFEVEAGERTSLVGESGAGKSVTGLSILQLLDYPGVIAGDSSIRWKGADLISKSDAEMDDVRGSEIAWIPQDPLSSLNPTRSIGKQIVETMRYHDYGSGKAQRRDRAITLLEEVGIPDAANRFDDYPNEYSGGMRQRVLIAMALSCEPNLIIADEPTTALDVNTQAQIVSLIKRVTENDTALLLITHALGLVAELCRNVMVMYSGRIVEKSDVVSLFDDPKHPYSRELLKCSPHLTKGKELNTIPGSMPVGTDRPSGCPFHPRCSEVMDECSRHNPELRSDEDERAVACLLYENQKPGQVSTKDD